MNGTKKKNRLQHLEKPLKKNKLGKMDESKSLVSYDVVEFMSDAGSVVLNVRC